MARHSSAPFPSAAAATFVAHRAPVVHSGESFWDIAVPVTSDPTRRSGPVERVTSVDVAAPSAQHALAHRLRLVVKLRGATDARARFRFAVGDFEATELHGGIGDEEALVSVAVVATVTSGLSASAWAAPNPNPNGPEHAGTGCTSVFNHNPHGRRDGRPHFEHRDSHFFEVGAALCGLTV